MDLSSLMNQNPVRIRDLKRAPMERGLVDSFISRTQTETHDNDSSIPSHTRNLSPIFRTTTIINGPVSRTKSPVSFNSSANGVSTPPGLGFGRISGYRTPDAKKTVSECIYIPVDKVEKFKMATRKDLLKKMTKNYLDFKQKEREAFDSLEVMRSHGSRWDRSKEGLSPKGGELKGIKRTPNKFPRKNYLKNFYESHTHDIVDLELLAKIRKQIEVEVLGSATKNRNKTNEAIELLRKTVIPEQSKKFISQVLEKEKERLSKNLLSRKVYSGGFNDFLMLKKSTQKKLGEKLQKNISKFSGNQQILIMNNFKKDLEIKKDIR